VKTALDCLPCLLKQALYGARLVAPDNPTAHREAMMAWSDAFSGLDLDRSPPDLAADLYKMLAATTGESDPFAGHKAESNRRALALEPRMAEIVAAAADPLETALAVAVIGNYVDPGAPHQADFEEALASEPLSGLDKPVLGELRETAKGGGRIVILGDNCGEIVLDKLLVRELSRLGARVTFAVRGGPVLNDATLEDAHGVGMADLCQVVSSGSDAPGTVLSRCSPEFLKLLGAADAVVSKGQGNFEALFQEVPGVFFAFKVKCPVVAGQLGSGQGSTIFARP
jgi:hypothetical protein